MSFAIKIRSMNKLNLTYIIGWLTVVFSVFVLESAFKISPVHASGILAVLFLTYKFFYKKQIVINDVFLIAFASIFYFAATQILFVSSDKILQYFNFLFKLLYFVITVVVLEDLNKKDIIKITENFIGFSIILFIVEAIIRFKLSASVGINFSNPAFFYALKENCIMYPNTCMLGFQIVTLFFLTFYLNTIRKKNYYLICQILLFILSILTFSRASIATIVIFWTIFKYHKAIYNPKKLLGLLFIALILFLTKDLYMGFMLVGRSLDTKISVFQGISRYLQSASLNNILIGSGLFNVVDVLNETGDPFLSKFFIGSGLLGTFFILGLYLYLIIKTRLKAGYLLLPLLFHGFFLFSPSTVLYCSLAIIYLLERKSREINE